MQSPKSPAVTRVVKTSTSVTRQELVSESLNSDQWPDRPEDPQHPSPVRNAHSPHHNNPSNPKRHNDSFRKGHFPLGTRVTPGAFKGKPQVEKRTRASIPRSSEPLVEKALAVHSECNEKVGKYLLDLKNFTKAQEELFAKLQEADANEEFIKELSDALIKLCNDNHVIPGGGSTETCPEQIRGAIQGYIDLLKHETHDLRHKIEGFYKEIDKVSIELGKLKVSEEQIRSERNKLLKEKDDLLRELQSEADAQREKSSKYKQELEGVLKEREGHLSTFKDAIDKLKREVRDSQARANDAEQNLKAAKMDLAEAERKPALMINKLKEDRERLSRQGESLQEELKAAKAQLDRGSQERLRLIEILNKAVSRLRECNSQLDVTSSKEISPVDQNSDLAKETGRILAILFNELAAAWDRNRSLQGEKSSLQEELKKCETDAKKIVNKVQGEVAQRYKDQLDGNRKELDGLAAKINEMNVEYARVKQQNYALENELDANGKRHMQELDQLGKRYETDYHKWETKVEELHSRVTVLHKDLAEYARVMKELKQELERAKKLVAEKDAIIQRLEKQGNSETEKLKRQLEDLEHKLQERMNDFRREKEQFSLKEQSFRQKYAELERMVHRLRKEMAGLSAAKEDYNERIQGLLKSLELEHQKIKDLTAERQKMEFRFEELWQDREALASRLAASEVRMQKYRQTIEDLILKYRDLEINFKQVLKLKTKEAQSDAMSRFHYKERQLLEETKIQAEKIDKLRGQLNNTQESLGHATFREMELTRKIDNQLGENQKLRELVAELQTRIRTMPNDNQISTGLQLDAFRDRSDTNVSTERPLANYTTPPSPIIEPVRSSTKTVSRRRIRSVKEESQEPGSSHQADASVHGSSKLDSSKEDPKATGALQPAIQTCIEELESSKQLLSELLRCFGDQYPQLKRIEINLVTMTDSVKQLKNKIDKCYEQATPADTMEALNEKMVRVNIAVAKLTKDVKETHKILSSAVIPESGSESSAPAASKQKSTVRFPETNPARIHSYTPTSSESVSIMHMGKEIEARDSVASFCTLPPSCLEPTQHEESQVPAEKDASKDAASRTLG